MKGPPPGGGPRGQRPERASRALERHQIPRDNVINADQIVPAPVACVGCGCSGLHARLRCGSRRTVGARGRTRQVISAGDSDQSRDDGAAAGRRIVHPSNIPLRHAKQRRQASNHVSDEVLTLLVPGVSEQTIAALGRRLRLSRAASLTADNITTFRWKILDRRPAPAVVRSLQAEPIVLSAQPNYTYQLAGASRPPSHGRSGRTRLSLNGSKPLISPEAGGVDRDDPLRR
jgi:hypothetical protein